MDKLLLAIAMFLSSIAQSGGERVDIPIQAPSDLNGYGSTFSQDLGITPEQVQAHQPYITEGVYLLTFSVTNQLPHYPGYYTVEIDFGAQELCDGSGWAKSTEQQIIVVCPVSNHIVIDNSEPGGGPAQGNNNFVAHWHVDMWPIYFKSASFTFVPTATN